MGLWVAEITWRWGCGWLWDSNPKRNQVLAGAVVAEITGEGGEREREKGFLLKPTNTTQF
jgi:hypothetical protein